MRQTFDMSQGKEFGEWMKKATAGAARRGAVSAAFRTLGVVVNELIPGELPQPVDQGAYRAGWHVEVTPEGADLVNSVPYASIIEYGARAENIKIGRKMIDALVGWVTRKGLVPKGDGPAAVRGLAWAIATSMQKKGIFNRDGRKGLRILERAAKRARKFFPEEVRREMKREGG